MKKKTDDLNDLLPIDDKIYLKPEHYWQWRNIIEDMHHANTKKDLLLSKHKIMELTIELQKLTHQLFKEKILKADSDLETKKSEYNKYKEMLEVTYKTSLNDCTINEDFAITKLGGK